MRIDWWTLALQTVNAAVLIWLLGRFLYRPVVNIIAQRQEAARQQMEEIEATRKSLAEKEAEIERTRAAMIAEGEKMIAEAEKVAEARGDAILAQAHDMADKVRLDNEAAMERERAAAGQVLSDRASVLAVDIAQRLLKRLPPAGATQAFLDSLCAEIRALAPDVRAAFIAATKQDTPIAVVTAGPLTEDETQRVKTALSETLGTEVRLTYRVDPSLVAGIELHSPVAVIRNSWREDLEHMREELVHDEEHFGHAR